MIRLVPEPQIRLERWTEIFGTAWPHACSHADLRGWPGQVYGPGT